MLAANKDMIASQRCFFCWILLDVYILMLTVIMCKLCCMMQMFSQGQRPIVGCKAVRVGDFNGKTLSTIGSSVIMVDPPHPRSDELRRWQVVTFRPLYTITPDLGPIRHL